MPANLTPQYFDVEKKYKAASTNEERVQWIEELLAIIPKHKGTEKLQAMWKTKMAKLKDAAQKKGGPAKYTGHKVKKSGAGQVVIIGPPNTGKSLLLQTLSDTELSVSENAFSTHEPTPVMMNYENIKIQLVDTPPVTPEFMEDWFPDLVKGSDAVVFILDLADDNCLDFFDGILSNLMDKKIQFIDYREDFPNKLERGWSYKKTLCIGSKIDLIPDNELIDLYREELKPRFHLFPFSAFNPAEIETLRREIFKILEIIRVYSKIPGKKTERESPFTLPIGSNVMDMAKSVHKDFAENLKFARIWGQHVYEGQRVNYSHILEDEDTIELHM